MRKTEATDNASWGPAGMNSALVCAEAAFAEAFHYWRGASGRRYLHSVYTLIGCPALPQANSILVRRHEDGTRVALAFGQTAISLNLAHLRHQGAKHGANEVHIHLLAKTAEERSMVEADLSGAHFRRLAAPRQRREGNQEIIRSSTFCVEPLHARRGARQGRGQVGSAVTFVGRKAGSPIRRPSQSEQLPSKVAVRAIS